MQTNVRKAADLVDPNTGEYLEVDILLPSLRLAFEYQVWWSLPLASLSVASSKYILAA